MAVKKAKKTTRKTTAKKAKVTKKTTAKRTAAKKPAKKMTRKTTAKKSPAKKAVKKVIAKRATSAFSDTLTKTQIHTEIAETTGLSKKEISTVFEELTSVVERHVKKRGPGEFTLPGLLKIKVVRKPATKARKGINPFTGEETVFKAKPARNVVKIKPLKKLKDMVA